jgi:hypothetical protein
VAGSVDFMVGFTGPAVSRVPQYRIMALMTGVSIERAASQALPVAGFLLFPRLVVLLHHLRAFRRTLLEVILSF